MISAERCMEAINYDHHSASSTSLFLRQPSNVGAGESAWSPATGSRAGARRFAVKDVKHGLVNPEVSLAECVKVSHPAHRLLRRLQVRALCRGRRRSLGDEVCPSDLEQAYLQGMRSPRRRPLMHPLMGASLKLRQTPP